MEPVSIISLIMTCVLVFERLYKYTLTHVKKSKCCGSEIEFDNRRQDSGFIDVTKI